MPPARAPTISAVVTGLVAFSFLSGQLWADVHYTIPPPHRVVVAVNRDMSTFDPLRLSREVDVLAASTAYETLVQPGAGGLFRGGLAESWTLSPDGRRFTFRLRRGVIFHDRTRLDAATIASNAMRGMREAVPPYDIITSVRATSDSQLEISTARAFPAILAELAGPSAFIASSATLRDPSALSRQPFGTGPFKYKQRAIGEYMSLERFNEYRAGTARINGIVFLVAPDASARAQFLREGRANALRSLSCAKT